MMMTAQSGSKDLSQFASLMYLEPLPSYSQERPYYIFDDVPKGAAKGNLKPYFGPKQLVEDVRHSDEVFDLNIQGFTFRRDSEPVLVDWGSQDDIENRYIPRVKALLADLLGETIYHCEPFDWRLRHAASTGVLREPEPQGHQDPQMVKISPALQVHVDQTPLGVLDRMTQIFGDETASLAAKYRVRLIKSAFTLAKRGPKAGFDTDLLGSVWRPLVDVVEDHPLALCDARSASLDDLIEVSFVDRGYIRHNYMAKYNPNFRLCYLSNMRSDETCIFKVFDSKDGVAKRVLHSAFKSQFAPPSCKKRESIEVRLIVLSALD